MSTKNIISKLYEEDLFAHREKALKGFQGQVQDILRCDELSNKGKVNLLNTLSCRSCQFSGDLWLAKEIKKGKIK